MRALRIVTLILLIVGGLNWGLVALFDFDLVTAILGTSPHESSPATSASRVVYILVAISALYQLIPLGELLSGHTYSDIDHDPSLRNKRPNR